MMMMQGEWQGVAAHSEVFGRPCRVTVYLSSVKRCTAFFCCSEHAFVLIAALRERQHTANLCRNAVWGQSSELIA